MTNSKGRTGRIAPWWGLHDLSRLRLTYANRILGVAVELERAVEQGRGPLDRVHDAYRRKTRKMGSNDRRVLSMALYGFARSRNAILMATPDAAPGERLYIGLLDQYTEETRPTIDDKYAAMLANLTSLRASWFETIEDAWQVDLHGAGEEVVEAFCGLFSVPGFWLTSCGWESVGEAAGKLNPGRFEQALQLRVDTAKVDREVVAVTLRNDFNVDVVPTSLSPWGLIVSGRVDLNKSTSWKRGEFEVQDEGSQLVALAGGPYDRPMAILDYCAGAGGKALAMAALGGKNVRIAAHDNEPKRLYKGVPRFQRGGYSNIELKEVLNDGDIESFDLVLVDAPCSSSGTIRRNPLIPQRWKPSDINTFSRIQRDILVKAADYVQPGGLLVYVTCSLFVDESEEVIRGFLSDHPQFKGEGSEGLAALGIRPERSNHSYRLSMELSGAMGGTSGGYSGDGFFISRMRRSV